MPNNATSCENLQRQAYQLTGHVICRSDVDSRLSTDLILYPLLSDSDFKSLNNREIMFFSAKPHNNGGRFIAAAGALYVNNEGGGMWWSDFWAYIFIF